MKAIQIWRATSSFRFCALALVALLVEVNSAWALPLVFTNINVTSSNQSRINMVATATLSGAPLTEGAQFPSGGFNSNGSESTLYAQTSSNTPSNMVANVGLNNISFMANGTAMAANTAGLLGDFSLTPAVGGGSGTASGDYGVSFSSPQSIVIPPIDVSALNIPGLTTLNLGTLTAINLNVALRNVVLGLTSAPIPLAPGFASFPTHFDSTQATISVTGTADMSLTATLKQANLADFLITNAALLALQSALSGQGIAITVSNQNFITDTEQIGFGFTTPLPATNAANGDASQGTVDHVGSNLRLTLPVKFDIQPSIPAPINTLITGADFAMSGQLIGQTPFVVIPEPSSLTLGGLGLLGLVALTWRRRRGA